VLYALFAANSKTHPKTLFGAEVIRMVPDSFAAQRGNDKLYEILKRQREALVVKR
jgi:hypothetical protein